MNSACRIPVFWVFVLLLMFASLCSFPQTAQAQADSKLPLKVITEAQTRELLAQKVQLKLGETTLPVVVKALSEQTGLQIEAAGYLREHRLQLSMNDVSAQDVLETLGELNDWKWQITEPGHVLIGRPQPKTPLTVTEVSLALQAALPKDVRRFIGSNGLKDAMYMPNANLSRSETAALAKRAEQAKKTPSPDAFAEGNFMGAHIANMAYGKRLLDTLMPRILDKKPLLCTRLAPEQQQNLIRVLTLNALEEILKHQHNLLSGVLRPHQRDPENIDVSVQNGNLLLIATYIYEIHKDQRFAQFSGTSYQIDAPATNPNGGIRIIAPTP